jgi:hypothetical protein
MACPRDPEILSQREIPRSRGRAAGRRELLTKRERECISILQFIVHFAGQHLSQDFLLGHLFVFMIKNKPTSQADQNNP